MAGSETPQTDQSAAPTTHSNALNGMPNGEVWGGINPRSQAEEENEELDEFGLPVKRIERRPPLNGNIAEPEVGEQHGEDQGFESARQSLSQSPVSDVVPEDSKAAEHQGALERASTASIVEEKAENDLDTSHGGSSQEAEDHQSVAPTVSPFEGKLESISATNNEITKEEEAVQEAFERKPDLVSSDVPTGPSQEDKNAHARMPSIVDNLLQGGTTGGVSAYSHQALAPHKPEDDTTKEEEWQNMPAFAPYDIYNDDGKLIARESRGSDDEADAYTGLGGAGKGYTKVQLDDDAQSATSMDDNTDYLFKPKGTDLVDEDEDQRDPLAQLQATKDLLTEGQRIAYVGVTRLAMANMVKEMDDIEITKNTRKGRNIAIESMKMWSQQMMVRLYMHMEIDSSEQVMIEQLAEHGVEPGDLTPALMQNARVKNPMADDSAEKESVAPPKLNGEERESRTSSPVSLDDDNADTAPLPPYREHEDGDMPDVRRPSQLGKAKNIDIDLRWTVLCDLFLVLLADSTYDARSRTLLERVGASLRISWLEICRFEKRVTDSLEMQEAANKETWDEAEHMENRRKQALKRRYMMMGIATVGGSLVIGLSAGLLAPVIGAGLAAGFTTIGVAGTGGFLAGAGGTALITSGAVLTGGTIAVRASNRRMGAVRTFEYQPLHNNKRVNLVLTISGWMNGKVDDVRLPYSTIDPVMGDIYSLLWEPEMLQSMGDTISILATEALTQGLQQVLGSTILIALMASLQLPIVLTKLSYLIDNPWTVSMGRANAAGLILADSLIDRNLGVRPITLVGFSLGARVIFAALRELANRGAFGLIQNVYLFGSPIVANKDEYLRVRAIVSGRFVNGYASNDWILGYLFRATSGGIMRVAGLAPLEGVQGLENIDVTKLVNGHMAYRAAMPRLLREVGWEIESDEFTEIVDPDPENHERRQRELIRELDEARKEAEAKPSKRRFGFFKKGKLAEKKRWETYDDSMRKEDEWSAGSAESGNVLFDIEAIKAELHSEQIEVRQLESTLPPMKLDLNGSRKDCEPSKRSPYSSLRPTQSYDESMAFRPRNLDVEALNSSLPNGHTDNPYNQGYDEYNLSAEAVGLQQQGSAKRSQNSLESPQRSPSHLPGSASHSKLSFEGSLRSPSPRPPSQVAQESPRLPGSPLKEQMNDTPPPQRPPLRSSLTTPSSSTGPVDIGQNAWLEDDDDPDFGKEQEVKLTF
ncbi:hypothetical protein P7C71_g92, partial [Lecanoromycetidae sp. Uapishka_2]